MQKRDLPGRLPVVGRSRGWERLLALGAVVALLFGLSTKLPLPPAAGSDQQAAATAPTRSLTVSYGSQRWQLVGEPDDAGVRAFAERIAQALDRPAVEARVEYDATRDRLVPSQPGRAVDVTTLTTRIEQALRLGDTSDSSVSVPMTEVPPATSTETLLKQLGITTTVATGSSDFTGSDPARVTNVQVAAKIIDGTLVPPGGVFSYNYALGAIVSDPGFVMAAAAEGGVPGTSLGGGVCQISTTVFRAALSGGLPITEWWPHDFRYPYYEHDGWGPGYDASIDQPDAAPLSGGDLKFVNPTGGWMLVHVTLQGSKVTVQLAGAPTGYHVKLEPPVYSDPLTDAGAAPVVEVDPTLPPGTSDVLGPAENGLTVTVVREVTGADGQLIATNTFVSHYQPHGEMLRVSPDQATAG